MLDAQSLLDQLNFTGADYLGPKSKDVRCSPEMARWTSMRRGATTFVEHVAPLERECRARSQSLAGQDADKGCARRIEAGP